MKVKEVMNASSLKYCTPETKLHNAAKTMKANNCGALPVVNEEKKVLGIITDRDICLSLAKKSSQPLEKRTVAEAMSKKVHTVKSDDEVATALQNMRKNQIGRLPVVDEQGKLKGIVSLHRLINQTVAEGKENLGNISAPGENILKTIEAVTDRYNGKKTEKLKEAAMH